MNLRNLPLGERIFIDANIFIYHFGELSLECKDFLRRCYNREFYGFTITSVLAEVLHRLMITEAVEKGLIIPPNALRKLSKNTALVKQLSKYSENVAKISKMNITILPLTSDIIDKSAGIRREVGLLTNDSLIVCAMKKQGINKLATRDDGFDHINWLEVYKPSDI